LKESFISRGRSAKALENRPPKAPAKASAAAAPPAAMLGTAPAKAPAKSVPAAKAPSAPARKAPVQSGKAKLRWDGDVANVTVDDKKVEIGRRVQQSDGWQAVVKDGGKNRVLGTGLSKDRAYGVVTKWYHYGEVPQAKSDKKASA
jgi:hypothetical protein